MSSDNAPQESLLLSLRNLSLSDHGSSTSRALPQPSPLPPSIAPSFSQSIWADHSASNTEGNLSRTWNLYLFKFVQCRFYIKIWFCWSKHVKNSIFFYFVIGANLQNIPCNVFMNEYDVNHQEETMRVNLNSGSEVHSMSIWENQESPFGKNLGRYNGLNLYNNRIQSQDYVTSHQESLSSDEVIAINSILGLEDSDIILLSNDQCGSKYLQKLLCWKDSRIINKMLGVVYRFPFYLMTHCHGHHQFVKLIESCDEEQLGLITMKITAQDELFFKASISKFG